MYAVSDWLCVVVHFDRDRFLSQKSTITSSYQLVLLLFLSTYLYSARSPLTLPLHNFPVTVKKSLDMPAFINHSAVFPFGARHSVSPHACFPDQPICLCILTLIVHSVFYSLVIAVWLLRVRPTSSDNCGLWGKEYELLLNKGNAAKMGMIRNTINVIVFVPQAEQIMFCFFYPFWMCMILCSCVCV